MAQVPGGARESPLVRMENETLRIMEHQKNMFKILDFMHTFSQAGLFPCVSFHCMQNINLLLHKHLRVMIYVFRLGDGSIKEVILCLQDNGQIS